MALLLGAKNGEVLSWRGTNELFDVIRDTLAQRAACMSGGAERGLLLELRDQVAEEIDYEERFAVDLAQALTELEQAEFEDELPSLGNRFHSLADDYFRRRGAVMAFHEISTTSYDVMLRKAIAMAIAGLELEELGPPSTPSCWLVAESAGRLERTPADSQQHFLVYAEDGGGNDAYFEKLSYRVTVLLKKMGLLASSERTFITQAFWRGSLEELRRWCDRELLERRHEHFLSLPVLPGLSAPFRPLHREDELLFRTMAKIADLRPLLGDPFLMAEVEGCTRNTLARLRELPLFSHVGRQVAVLPLALGMFGWFKVERRGRHQGEVDIEQLALNPLVMNLCILAVRHGVTATNTIMRIRELLNKGELSVDLAERLMRAYHEIMRHRIGAQLKEEGREGKGTFLNPEELSTEDGERFKAALESVASLQKYLHSCFAEHS